MDKQPDQALVRMLRDDRQHGSSELAQRVLAGLPDIIVHTEASTAAALRARLHDVADQLCAARPSMATITNQMASWKVALESFVGDDPERLRAHAVGATQRLQRQSQRAVEAAARNASRKLGTDQVVMTVSFSSTVRQVYQTLAPRIEAIVSESRPPSEGRQLAAQLSQLGIRTQFITDAQMGRFVSSADAVLVGADTVAADGSIINKCGTYLVALAARDCDVPFYACYESFKTSSLPAESIPIESYRPDEYNAPTLPHVTAHNVYFEITPPYLVSAWITEHGLFTHFPGSHC